MGRGRVVLRDETPLREGEMQVRAQLLERGSPKTQAYKAGLHVCPGMKLSHRVTDRTVSNSMNVRLDGCLSS